MSRLDVLLLAVVAWLSSYAACSQPVAYAIEPMAKASAATKETPCR